MIGVGIYYILANDTDVAAIVSTKIYPIQVKEGDSAPYISYQGISNVPANTKQTAALIDHYRVQVSSFATRKDKAELLAKKVRDALDNHALASYTNDTHDIKISSIVFDGEIPLHDDAANVFEVAQDYMVSAYITARTFADFFFPSKNLLDKMYDNLHAEGVGDFEDNYYWCSTESSATEAYKQNFSDGDSTASDKYNTWGVRPCRSFTSAEGAYSLRDIGPAGGLICYIDGTTYYEAYSEDLDSSSWSNNIDTEIGTTSADIDESQNNTDEIIAQSSYSTNAADRCNNLSI